MPVAQHRGAVRRCVVLCGAGRGSAARVAGALWRLQDTTASPAACSPCLLCAGCRLAACTDP